MRRIASHNDDATDRVYSIWHPMNHNLIYDEDEIGGKESMGSLSAMNRQSMGDYYIVDFLEPALIGGDDTITFNPEATLYWHER